jgi:hypothetical protein
MRDEIIEEHEIRKSPPRIPVKSRARHSKQPSVSTVRDSERQRIMLYLDTPPLSDSHCIGMAEPSPDLSDFLSFGSDDDSTPRGSWAPPKRQAKSGSTARTRDSKASPITPPSAARLSAVGAPDFFDDASAEPVTGAKKQTTGVRFVDEPKVVNGQDFLLDDTEAEGIWGM